MNRKQLLSLLALVVILGGAGLAVYKHTASSWESAGSPSGKVLAPFALNDVARVVIQNNDTTLTLEKKNDAWVVRERDDYPADFARVGNFIQGLWQLKPVQEEKVGPSQLARLDLAAPAKGAANTATLVEFQNKDSQRMSALLVGKKFLKKSPDFPSDEGVVSGRYVMPSGTAAAKVSLVSERLEEADPNPAAWLDKSFLRIGRIQSIAVTSGTMQWKLTRAADTAADWQLDGIQPGDKLDPAKASPLAGIFAAPTFTDVQPAAAKRDGFDATATVTTFDGFTYTLRFGKADGDKLPMTVTAAADLPKERTPGKDEKPEDKKRLDDAFAATSKQLAETLAKAKALEARVYLVPKATFDPLWKPASEFLAAKEQPAPTPAPAPGGK
ncbi:MAG: DUF4340 domain-containing protein [Chthoniobacteraceae bacterium]|nr:DUF4340 domain-containing protein [Chthoniobacteraceae bacterium]